MRRGSITRSTSLRLAALYMALFLQSYLGANLIAYNLVASYLNERLDSHVLERFREIETAFAARGIEGAMAMITSHGPAIRGEETLYILRDRSGLVLAGNSDHVAASPGFSTLEATDQHQTNYRLYRQALGPNDLTVGISYDDTNRLRAITLTSFGWATAIVLVIGVGGGTVLALRTRRRIAHLSQVMQLVGAGELSRRLPISRTTDDIDALAGEVNVALAQLEASVDAMKQVTTDVAHDLKTPIGRLYLLLEAARDADGEISRPMIATAMDEVRMITATFDALLRISQIEAGARKDRFTDVDIQELIEALADIYGDIAADEGRTLRVVRGRRTEALMVLGDAELLKQMLANLLSNAIRHTPRGARIDLACFVNKGRVCIAVADNGPGVPAAERLNIFKRFYRLEKSRTSEGSGLGLSLVKAIAELHAAAITLADNHPGLLVRVIFPPPNGRARKNPPVEVSNTGG
jgi:signal transduction histidine kinase